VLFHLGRRLEPRLELLRSDPELGARSVDLAGERGAGHAARRLERFTHLAVDRPGLALVLRLRQPLLTAAAGAAVTAAATAAGRTKSRTARCRAGRGTTAPAGRETGYCRATMHSRRHAGVE